MRENKISRGIQVKETPGDSQNNKKFVEEVSA